MMHCDALRTEQSAYARVTCVPKLCRSHPLVLLRTPQDGSQQSGRETPAKLSAHAANFSHKALCAALFGALGLHGRSVSQLAVLAVLQVC